MSGNARNRRRERRREERFWQAFRQMKHPEPIDRLRVLDGRVFMSRTDGSRWELDLQAGELREHHGLTGRTA